MALHIILWLYSEDFALGAHLIILVRDMLLARYLCLFVYLFFVVVRNLFHVVGLIFFDDNRALWGWGDLSFSFQFCYGFDLLEKREEKCVCFFNFEKP